MQPRANTLQALTAAELHARTRGALVLERARCGNPTVLRSANGMVYKLLPHRRDRPHPRKLPPAVSFRRNAERLAGLGIRTLEVQAQYNVPELRCDVVVYPFLAGHTVREYMQQHVCDHGRIFQLVRFVAELHRKGIYFRALHLGNVLLLPSGELALIDVGATAFRPHPLCVYRRARNFRILVRYPEDRAALSLPGLPRTLGEYMYRAGLSPLRRRLFLGILGRFRPDLWELIAAARATLGGFDGPLIHR